VCQIQVSGTGFSVLACRAVTEERLRRKICAPVVRPEGPPTPMKIRAAVVDPLPLYRRGVVACLGAAGWSIDLPDNVWAWAPEAVPQVVLLGICDTSGWRLLTELHAARPHSLLLAMIDTPDVRSYVRAIRSGATGVADRAGSPDALQESFTAMVNGQVLLPAEVVRALATASEAHEEPEPSEAECEWLRQLAGGSTVAGVAARAGYSERMMFRHLRSLYGRLSARNRTEALIRARERGWI
jgi:DNA-binding NarL/FixJ family response regulator